MAIRPGGAAGRMRRRVGASVVAAGCALAAMGLGGCGAGNVIDPVARAATVSNAASGMRMVFSLRLSAAVLPAPIVGTGTARLDPSRHAGSLSMVMSFAALPQVAQALGTSTVRIAEIISGPDVYVQLPGALARSPALRGRPWLLINLASVGGRAGIPGLSTLINNPISTDPGQLLPYLRATSGHVTRVGSGSVDGVASTHYRAVIQLDRVPQGFPAAERPEVRQAVAGLERIAHVRTIPFDVWVDDHHLVRRVRFSLSESVAGQPLEVQMRIDIPQYGPQPVPTPPAPAQVTDLSAGSSSSGATPAG